jgi:3-oxoacyl-[acyl-carrier protein] reductase
MAAIVTGGSSEIGRDVLRALARRGYAIVIVYLDDQPGTEATVEEVFAAGGTAVAVRADLGDELDVERLFAESTAAVGGVDVIVLTDVEATPALYECATRYLRRGGAIVSVPAGHPPSAVLAEPLRERGITVERGVADPIVFLERSVL